MEDRKKYKIKEGSELSLICVENNQKELDYMLARDFEQSWNVSVFVCHY